MKAVVVTGALGFIGALLLAACGPSAAVAPATAAPATAVPGSTVPGTTAPTVVLTADQIVARLGAAGLPMGQVIVYTDATDPNGLLGRPGQYTSKVNFSDTRHSNVDTQTVEVYPDVAGALARKAYVDHVTQGIPILAEYTYVEGTAVLRLDHQLLPAEAAAYDQALKGIAS